MPSLLLVVFVLQLVIHLVNTVGASSINNLLWILYNKLPTPTSADAKAQAKLRAEVVRLKRQMNATSSQDEFAKWAKLRRQHDKVLAEHDAKVASLKSFKATFDSVIGFARWGATQGLQFFLQFWYSKEAMLWIPQGWVPGYVEWILSFPRAKTGSVSIQVWGIACASVIKLVSSAIVALYALATEQKMASSSKGEPMKMASSTKSKSDTQSQGSAEKKEL